MLSHCSSLILTLLIVTTLPNHFISHYETNLDAQQTITPFITLLIVGSKSISKKPRNPSWAAIKREKKKKKTRVLFHLSVALSWLGTWRASSNGTGWGEGGLVLLVARTVYEARRRRRRNGLKWWWWWWRSWSEEAGWTGKEKYIMWIEKVELWCVCVCVCFNISSEYVCELRVYGYVGVSNEWGSEWEKE